MLLGIDTVFSFTLSRASSISDITWKSEKGNCLRQHAVWEGQGSKGPPLVLLLILLRTWKVRLVTADGELRMWGKLPAAEAGAAFAVCKKNGGDKVSSTGIYQPLSIPWFNVLWGVGGSRWLCFLFSFFFLLLFFIWLSPPPHTLSPSLLNVSLFRSGVVKLFVKRSLLGYESLPY